MKKTISALLAAATIAGSLVSVAPAAKADGGRIAAGVAGGLIGGALLGGAIAASRPGPAYGYAPARAAWFASASGTNIAASGARARFRFAIDLS
jgi:hypothetical protein